MSGKTPMHQPKASPHKNLIAFALLVLVAALATLIPFPGVGTGTASAGSLGGIYVNSTFSATVDQANPAKVGYCEIVGVKVVSKGTRNITAAEARAMATWPTGASLKSVHEALSNANSLSTTSPATSS